MLGRTLNFHSDAAAILNALSSSLAIIEFDPQGKVLTANKNFCDVIGYDLKEIVGRHHSMFVDPDYARSSGYKEFWAKLGRGEFDAREYKRIGKGGKEVWIQASYNPVRSGRGRIVKVVKVATDITAEKIKSAENAGKLDAISRAQAVIEFKVTGEIITANENFLATLGYRLDEIQGQHHRIFVEPADAQSADYRDFWAKLNRGEYVAEEFKRIGKGGKQVWIQASYNPIFDMNGKVMKIVKFATDITERVHAVNEIGASLSRLAEGDLEQRIDKAFIPALDKLRRDFNDSVDTLQAAMQKISHNVHGIRGGTEEIRISSDDLSKRTEQQAASLEETAASLDEITAAVRKTAEGASHARQVVGSAKNEAEQSGEVVRQAVEAMAGIEKSSGQIGQIIGVIDEIAFQTNLLALNAGVEAARAGEAGRGFAVVASEVRALAQRSAEAAKEIKALISASTAQVEQGAGLVGEAGNVLQRIVAKVGEINGIIAEIAASAQEQSTGLEQVNTAVNQMDQMTQQNAAMVEESTAATHALVQETEDLSRQVARFRLGAKAQPVASRTAIAGASGKARAAKQPVAALKNVGRGGAARKPEADADGWEEF